MNLPLKDDAAQLSEEIDSLAASDWLGRARKWWPFFLFHYTSIENAVNILERGSLYSRKYMEDSEGKFHDGASPEIISQTNQEWKEYVRLYFRPRTPTIYSNEGFRPEADWEYGAHCPVPICFLFDSKQVLTQEGVSFSDGSLASSNPNIYSTAVDYSNLPFEKIYHDSYFSQEDKPTIKFHRQAEILVKNELNLETLKKVFCRSEAEYRTLQFLINSSKAMKYKNMIGSSQKGNLFFKQWLFIERVDFEPGKLYVACSKPPSESSNFRLKFHIISVENESTFKLKLESNKVEYKVFYINLPNKLDGDRLIVKIYFDDCLMFADHFEPTEIPF